jgi:hypothetical protein
MTRKELFTKLIDDCGYSQIDECELKKGGSIIEINRTMVLVDTGKDFDLRNAYPIYVPIPKNENQFRWLYKQIQFIDTDEGFNELAIHNKTMITEYPIIIIKYNKKRIEVI